MRTIELTIGQEREIAYNAYLSSLDKYEIHALCNARIGDREQIYLHNGEFEFHPSDSLELYLHDMFVRAEIEEDTIGAEILVLLGEL